MTGYESKRAAARDKLEQTAFDAWWDTQPRLNETNPASVDSFEYWAWEGWHAALAQPAQQEPVAYWNFNIGFSHCMIDQLNEAAKKNPAPLYTTPPQRPWVDLTDEEIADYLGDKYHEMSESELRFFRLGEAAAGTHLYTNPQRKWVLQREWVDLTDEEIDKWAHELHVVIYAVMADLKEKNT